LSGLLALDLGTKLGWCKNGKEYGELNLKWDGKFCHQSFVMFRSFVLSHNMNNQDLKVAIEKPNSHMPGFHAYRTLFGMWGIIQLLVPDKNVILVSAKTIKKYWTGNGNASKTMMIIQTKEELGIDVTHNTADAIALYHYVVNKEDA
jgi:hypothetical protein